MNARFVTGLVAVVAVAAAAFYFWPKDATAPLATTDGTQQTTQQAATNGTVSMETQLSGTWRSNADGKFTREIRADGVIIDRYQGDATAGVNGQWKIVDLAKETNPSVPLASFPGKTVVKVEWEGGVETTYFVVTDLTSEILTTTDLTGRGDVTTYARVH